MQSKDRLRFSENEFYLYTPDACPMLMSIDSNEHMQHYRHVIMDAKASQINSVPIVYSTVCSGADQRKHQSSASLTFVRGIHRGWVNYPHKGSVTRRMFPFEDVIMVCTNSISNVWRQRDTLDICHKIHDRWTNTTLTHDMFKHK